MKTSVLILDGNRWQREVLAAALSYEGCRAVHTGEVFSALALLERDRFQLLLLDPAELAGSDSKIFERLHRLHPGLPVIAIVPDESHAISALMDGAVGVIRKPVDFFALLDAIELALCSPPKSSVEHGSQKGTLPIRFDDATDASELMHQIHPIPIT